MASILSARLFVAEFSVETTEFTRYYILNVFTLAYV